MRRKAFMLTADALFALTAIGILATSYAVMSSVRFDAQKYGGLQAQGRDYLELAYRQGFRNFTNDTFYALTRHNIYGGLGERRWTFDTKWDTEGWTQHNTNLDWNGNVFIMHTTLSWGEVYAGKASWNNYNASMAYDMTGITSPTKFAGLGFHANATGGRYLCLVNSIAPQNQIKLYKMLYWDETFVTDEHLLNWTTVLTGFDIVTGWHVINASIMDGNIKCTVDDGLNNKTLKYTDPAPFHAGRISIESSAGDFVVDNISVYYVPLFWPNNISFATRASMAEYPWSCGCRPTAVSCNISKTDACLVSQEPLEHDWITREVWVT